MADLRAPTPSAAAELAVTDMIGIQEQLQKWEERFQTRMRDRIEDGRREVRHLQARMNGLSPQNQIREKYQILTEKEEKLQYLMSQVLKNKWHQMLLYAERMKGLSPLDKLSQGYSYTADEKGHKVTEVDQVREGDLLQI